MEAVPVGLEAAAMGQPNFERYSWGIIPCLMAWPAVTMASGPGAFVIASTLAVTHVADRSFARRQLLPPWYMCALHPFVLSPPTDNIDKMPQIWNDAVIFASH